MDDGGGASPDPYRGGGGGSIRLDCKSCGDAEDYSPDDFSEEGFLSCSRCNAVHSDTQATGSDPNDFPIAGPIRIIRPVTQPCIPAGYPTTQQPPAAAPTFNGFDEPRDFVPGADAWGKPEELGARIRHRYVQGLQVILQRQLEALVDRHQVSALVCSVAGTVWARWVAASKVFDEMWANYSKDLHSYLKYCKDVVFPGIACSDQDEHLIEGFQDMYKGQKDENPKAHIDEMQTTSGVNKRGQDGTFVGARSFSASPGIQRTKSEMAKSEMEDHGFCYMPPRKWLKSDGYLHYRRKTITGSLVCVGHADYYMLIRSFAKLAEVDIRTMHTSVLRLERRLAWIEEQIGRSLDALHNLPS